MCYDRHYYNFKRFYLRSDGRSMNLRRLSDDELIELLKYLYTNNYKYIVKEYKYNLTKAPYTNFNGVLIRGNEDRLFEAYKKYHMIKFGD